MLLGLMLFACFCQTGERANEKIEPKIEQSAERIVPVHKQVLLVETESWLQSKGKLSRFEWTAKDGWRSVAPPINVTLAGGGMAWGIGLYDVPKEEGEAVKMEGDYRSPAGVFALTSSFGTTRKQMIAWDFPYRETNPNIKCITDPESQYYNRIVHQQKVAKEDWNSFVEMRGSVNASKWGVIIDQNPRNERAKGACVFLQVQEPNKKGTSGGTALAERELIDILPWLRRDSKPILVQSSQEGLPRVLAVLKENGIELSTP